MLRRTRPKLPKVPEEMQQWSELLLHEILRWPQVTSRPMFGMTAVYRKNAIFGVLPRTRAMGTKYSISFKIPQRTPNSPWCNALDFWERGTASGKGIYGRGRRWRQLSSCSGAEYAGFGA
jgi:hypothetical protein